MKHEFARVIRRVTCLAALVGAMGMVCPAFAQILPSDHHQSVSLTFDRSSVPDSWIFRRQHNTHYTPGNGIGSRTAHVCRSNVDTTLGACPVRPANVFAPTPTSITLRFMEERSKLQVDLVVGAIKVITVSGSTCTHVNTPFHSNRDRGRCQAGPYDVSRYTLSISRAELQKIPVGGLWRARLEFYVRELENPVPSATHSYDIELRVTDNQNAQIYFPTLSSISPRVALDLRRRPGPNFVPIVYGGRSVDMCFYDGFGSNSPGALRVRASDARANFPARPPGNGLLVRRGTDGSQPRQRIEYRVGLTYAGAHRWVNVGDTVGTSFTSVAQAPIRIVRLPGIPAPVACTPGTLAFEVVPFVEREKDAGSFEGPLRIEMFVDAARM
ncbi:CfaE/CblD family pilus tip adhesin [Pandoraea oxalativorans]|nr:CfaE/CblD family pilus tip adhesin [Pandoraea oxalativorans]